MLQQVSQPEVIGCDIGLPARLRGRQVERPAERSISQVVDRVLRPAPGRGPATGVVGLPG